MKKIEYDYSDRDLLTVPEKYQMTAFEGIEFLYSYKKSREDVLKTIETCQYENWRDVVSEILDSNKLVSKNKMDQEKFVTRDLLNIIYKENVRTLEIQRRDLLDQIIKKFEIRKKIFVTYNNQFKEITEEYSDLLNYLLLSINCILAYQKSHNLRYLNTSLKLNDLIISQIKSLTEKNMMELCKILLQLELESIVELCRKKGIELQ